MIGILGYLIQTMSIYHPVIQMYSNVHLSIMTVSSGTIYLMKLAGMAVDVVDFKWRYTCLILYPLFGNGCCPFVWKLTENSVYFTRQLYRCFKLVYLHVCVFKLFVILLCHVPEQMKLCILQDSTWEHNWMLLPCINIFERKKMKNDNFPTDNHGNVHPRHLSVVSPECRLLNAAGCDVLTWSSRMAGRERCREISVSVKWASHTGGKSGELSTWQRSTLL